MLNIKEKIVTLQKNAKCIRNVSILGGKSHGKTEFADFLIVKNGINSISNAGPMRYLDNRPDEQERKMTMKTSNISLYFKRSKSEYLINLIDSPGHVDFSSETSTAVLLADGAIVVLDVFEGVCAQTRSILSELFKNNLKPVLFLNKIDRLILEIGMSSKDAEEHIRRVLEQVNEAVGNIFACLEFEDDSKELESGDDSSCYFNPFSGNVIFGSVRDGWASNTIMFASKILENVWFLYKTVMFGGRKEIIATCEALKLKYRPPKSTSNQKTILKSICMESMPLEKAVFEKIITVVSSPDKMFNLKLSKLMRLEPNPNPKIEFEDNDESKVIAYVAKMVPILFRDLQACDVSLRNIPNEHEDENYVFIAFTRIYSGVIKQGSKVHLVKPGYNPKLKNQEQLERVEVKRVYLLMGMNFVPIEEAHEGMIVGIWGFQKHVIKNGSLTSSFNCPPFNGMDVPAPPVLRVAVEPKNIDEMPNLSRGLKMLNLVDSSVQVMIQDSGETVLCVLGEVHLDKCIRDLTESYAKIELNVSKPIVPFRETIVMESAVKPKDILDEEKTVTFQARNNTCNIKMIAIPLPSDVVTVLENNKEQLEVFIGRVEDPRTIKSNNELLEVKNAVENVMKPLLDKIISSEDIWSLGPKKSNTCMLVNKSQYKHLDFWATEANTGHFDRAIISGFQAAVQSGPICHEPIHGVCFVLKEFCVDEKVEKNDSSISAIITTAVKEACRAAFKKQSQKLVSQKLSLCVITNTDVLGTLFSSELTEIEDEVPKSSASAEAKLTDDVTDSESEDKPDQWRSGGAALRQSIPIEADTNRSNVHYEKKESEGKKASTESEQKSTSDQKSKSKKERPSGASKINP